MDLWNTEMNGEVILYIYIVPTCQQSDDQNVMSVT